MNVRAGQYQYLERGGPEVGKISPNVATTLGCYLAPGLQIVMPFQFVLCRQPQPPGAASQRHLKVRSQIEPRLYSTADRIIDVLRFQAH